MRTDSLHAMTTTALSQWITTAEAAKRLGISRETMRKLRHRGVFKPGRDFRRWSCLDRGPLQWHAENIDAALSNWSRRNLAA